MNDEPVYRTAPATLGLLNIMEMYLSSNSDVSVVFRGHANEIPPDQLK